MEYYYERVMAGKDTSKESLICFQKVTTQAGQRINAMPSVLHQCGRFLIERSATLKGKYYRRKEPATGVKVPSKTKKC